MNILRNFLFLTIPQFFKNNEVRREVCKIASVCGGGSGGSAEWGGITGDIQNQTDLIELIEDIPTPNLQTVTEGAGNNVTSSAIQLTGITNLSLSVPSLFLAYTSGQAFINKSDPTGNGIISFEADGKIILGAGNTINNSYSPVLTIEDTSGSGDNILTVNGTTNISGSVVASGVVKAAPATDPDDLVRLDQLPVFKGGQSPFTADGSTTEFDIIHNLGATPAYFTLTTTTPITQNHLNRTITFPDDNTMRITFSNAPTIGEDVNYVWIVYQ